MPTYEYACNACSKEFEIEQKIVDSALVDCPQCGKPALKRLVSATKFVLTGKGWARDGYSTTNRQR